MEHTNCQLSQEKRTLISHHSQEQREQVAKQQEISRCSICLWLEKTSDDETWGNQRRATRCRLWNLFFSMACEKDDPSNMDAIGMIMILVRFFTVKTEKIFSGDILLSSTNNKNSFLVFCGWMVTWEPVRLWRWGLTYTTSFIWHRRNGCDGSRGNSKSNVGRPGKSESVMIWEHQNLRFYRPSHENEQMSPKKGPFLKGNFI